MEREPERSDQITPSSGNDDEPPPYAPDPRLIDVMERGADTEPAEAWARLNKRRRSKGSS